MCYVVDYDNKHEISGLVQISGMVEEKHHLVTYHAINHVVYNSSCVMSLGLTHK